MENYLAICIGWLAGYILGIIIGNIKEKKQRKEKKQKMINNI